MNPPPDPEPTGAARRSPHSLRWLSQDYGVLRQEARRGTAHDVVIVGSG